MEITERKKLIFAAFAGLLIGLMSLLLQLFIGPRYYLFAFIALIPLGYVWILHEDEFSEYLRETYVFTALAQLLFGVSVFLFPEFYQNLVLEFYILLKGQVSFNLVKSAVMSVEVIRPVLYSLATLGIVELAVDEELRELASDFGPRFKRN